MRARLVWAWLRWTSKNSGEVWRSGQVRQEAIAAGSAVEGYWLVTSKDQVLGYGVPGHSKGGWKAGERVVAAATSA